MKNVMFVIIIESQNVNEKISVRFTREKREYTWENNEIKLDIKIIKNVKNVIILREFIFSTGMEL